MCLGLANPVGGGNEDPSKAPPMLPPALHPLSLALTAQPPLPLVQKVDEPVAEKRDPEPAGEADIPAPDTGRRLLGGGGHRETILLDAHEPVGADESAKDEKPAEDDRFVGKYHGLSLAIAGFLFVVFVLGDVYFKANANWIKTLLKIFPLVLGLAFAAWGLWSKSVVTKCVAAVLIGLFLMHAVNRRPLQYLLPRSGAHSAEMKHAELPLPEATTNN